jgi:chromosome segregation ATPase
MYMFVDMGGAFVNSEDHPNQSQVVKQFMDDYYFEVRKRVVSEELKEEERKQADLEKDLKKLKEKKEDYLNEIEKCKQKIAEAEKNIEKNAGDQVAKDKEIDAQKSAVKKVVEKLNNLAKKIE